MIKFNDFTVRYKGHRREIDAAVKRVFTRGWFILGEELQSFEAEFATFLGAKHVVGVNSGTDAIALALRAAGVGSGHEVLTVANTATPTVSAIRMTGAKPVFVDIDPRTSNMDPRRLAGAVSRRTRAIVPVHLFGYPAEMNEVLAFSRNHKLVVIEDCAQAAGARYRGRPVGTFGDLSAFSFYPTKNLGAFGDAGAVATNDDRYAASLRRLRNYGEESKYWNTTEGVNSRLDEIQAALLRWGLKKLGRWTARRSAIVSLYRTGLAGLPIELPPVGDERHEPAWHLFVIKAKERDDLQAFLKGQGIQTALHYPRPIYAQPAYRFLKYSDRRLPETAQAMSMILSLPLYPELRDADVRRVCKAIRQYYAAKR